MRARALVGGCSLPVAAIKPLAIGPLIDDRQTSKDETPECSQKVSRDLGRLGAIFPHQIMEGFVGDAECVPFHLTGGDYLIEITLRRVNSKLAEKRQG